jgi:hypothetical protein
MGQKSTIILIEKVYASVCLSLIFSFVIVGTCFALILLIYKAPDEVSHYLSGLRNYALISRGKDSYCGYNTDILKLGEQKRWRN